MLRTSRVIVDDLTLSAPFAAAAAEIPDAIAANGEMLAFDNAISPQAAEIKGIKSPVAGHAQILVMPDLEAGNMLVKQLTFLADADSAGIVLGARVPIVFTSRADSVRNRLASVALGVLLAHRRAAIA